MAVLIDNDTRLIVQGITGHQGMFHTKAMQSCGTKVVGGVTPGKGGETVAGVPVFDSVAGAVARTSGNTSIVFVPAPFAKDAVYEAVDAGIGTIVVITEHIPVHDAMDFVHYAKYRGATVIGPNTPGVISPGTAKVGIMPSAVFKPGDVGVISRSGTLTYEVVNELSNAGHGQSTCIGMGGDPVVGTNFIEALRLLETDRQTKRVVLIGEIGGTAEEEAAAFITDHVRKPVAAYIAGRSAPPGKRMGHAGAIITRGRGTAESKVQALTKAGVKVARVPGELPELLR